VGGGEGGRPLAPPRLAPVGREGGPRPAAMRRHELEGLANYEGKGGQYYC
jgi:hypothetical protein